MWRGKKGFPLGFSRQAASRAAGFSMARQAKSVESRKQFFYRQQELMAMHQSNGKVTCEKRREYSVTPMPSGIERKLVPPPEPEGEAGHLPNSP